MDKKNLEVLHRSLAGNPCKTASALREMLSEREAAVAPANGSRSARERIVALFDEGTFMELGAYVMRRSSEFETGKSDDLEAVLCGFGSVNGCLVYAFSQDFSRTRGGVSEAQAKKLRDLYRLATENGAPVVGIFDSAGAYLPEGVRALAAYGAIMREASLASGVVPQIAVVPGIAQGAAAIIAAMFDFLIITEKTASVSVNPPFLTGAETGKAPFAKESGMAAISVSDDDAAIAKARELLSYLPANNAEGTVEAISADDCNRTVSLDAYAASGDMKACIAAFADDGKFVELYAEYAPEAVCGFCSAGGVVCGVLANNHAVCDGTLTAPAARKLAKLLSFCDAFAIPVITVVDSHGLDISKEAESAPYAAEIAKLAGLYASARTALITVIAGEAYGSIVPVMGAKSLGADIVLAREDAKIGVMNAASAVAFLWNDKIGGNVTREALETEWNETVGTPAVAAMAGEVDDVIVDAELRQRLCAAVMMLRSKSKNAPVRRHANLPL